MNSAIRFASLPLALLLCSTAALAGHGRQDRDWDDDDRDTERASERYVYAQVISARPIYTEVRVSEPREECIEERVVYRDEVRNDYPGSADRALGTVLGGVIGGVVGHQVGHGSGRRIATAVGAVVGASIGGNAVSRSYGERRETRERVAYEPRCRTVRNSRYESRIDGYDVTYRYQGAVYNTRLPYDPGARLPVRVEVSPIRY